MTNFLLFIIILMLSVVFFPALFVFILRVIGFILALSVVLVVAIAMIMAVGGYLWRMKC